MTTRTLVLVWLFDSACWFALGLAVSRLMS